MWNGPEWSTDLVSAEDRKWCDHMSWLMKREKVYISIIHPSLKVYTYTLPILDLTIVETPSS